MTRPCRQKAHAWTAAQLAHHSRQLQAGYGLNPVETEASDTADTWSEQTLTHLGRSLASAHLLGL
jgi:hypothetical protein